MTTPPSRTPAAHLPLLARIEQQYFGIALALAAALAVLLMVSFVGVLNSAVERGEMRRLHSVSPAAGVNATTAAAYVR